MTYDFLRSIAAEPLREAAIHDLAAKVEPTLSGNEALHGMADEVKPQATSNSAIHSMARPLKSAIHSVKDSLTSQSKLMPNRAMSDDNVVHGNDLARVASEALQVNPGEVRFVIHLPYRHLKDYYLQTGGGQKLASPEVFTDDLLKKFITDPSSGESLMFRLPEHYTVKDLIHPKNASINGEMAILIDVPRVMADKLKNPNISLGLARKMLERIFNHKYYVMTLNTSKLKSVPETLGQNSNKDEMVELFNPFAVENYPIRQVLVAAKQEWNEEQEKKKVAKPAATSTEDALTHAEGQLAQSVANDKKNVQKPSEPAEPQSTHQQEQEQEMTTAEKIEKIDQLWKEINAGGSIPPEQRKKLNTLHTELKQLLDKTWRESRGIK